MPPSLMLSGAGVKLFSYLLVGPLRASCVGVHRIPLRLLPVRTLVGEDGYLAFVRLTCRFICEAPVQRVARLRITRRLMMAVLANL